MEFRFAKIGEICKKICSGGTPTSSNPLYYEGGTIPWLNTSEIDFCNIYETNKHITKQGLKNSAAKFIPINTIVVAMYGVTAGKSAIAKIPLTTNQACCNLIIDEEQLYYRFVYYFLKLESDSLNNLANGGAQQNLNSLIIKKIKISLPSLAIQRKIAGILSAYDALIENNNMRIKILERMAENIYREWFVRFRFPGHENTPIINGLPKGWKIEKIENVCNLFTGKKDVNQTDSNGKYSFFSCSPEKYFSNDYLYDGKAIIVAGNGSYTGRTTYYNGKFDLYQRTYALVSNNKDNDDIILYLYARFKFDFEKMFLGGTRGAAIPYIVRKDLSHYKFFYHKETVNQYIDIIVPIFSEIDKLKEQNVILARQRDALLPRLMSGKLEVKSENE